MILSELARHLADQGCASLRDLAYHFDTDPETLRIMLDLLARKGRVRRLPMGTLCGNGCRQCDPAALERYEWVKTDPKST